MTRLITFDLDNTLWDVDPVIVRADYAMSHWFDDRFPGFNQMFGSEELQELKTNLIDDSPNLKANISELRIETYRLALEKFGLPKGEAREIAKSAFDFFHMWRQRVDLYPQTEKILWQLANRYRLAVITNGNADVFHEHIGLGGSFEFAIRADQVGIAKPNVEIFHKAAEQAKVATSNIIHVGDHPHDDVKGINHAGGQSVWFNRHGARRWLDEWGEGPNIEIHSLEELPVAIDALIK